MLLVCTSATDPDYATTGDVMMTLYGSTTTANVATTQEINYLGSLVRRASGWAESYIGQPLGAATYQETVPAYGGRHLMLSRTPIRVVLRLFDATDTGEASEYFASCGEFRVEDAEAGLLSRDQGFAWSQVERFGGGDFSLGLTSALQPGMEKKPWLVEYIAGYVPIGGMSTDAENFSTAAGATSTVSTLPEDLRHGVVIRAAEMSANPLGIVTRSVGDLNVTYRAENPYTRSMSAIMLDPYRRIV